MALVSLSKYVHIKFQEMAHFNDIFIKSNQKSISYSHFLCIGKNVKILEELATAIVRMALVFVA